MNNNKNTFSGSFIEFFSMLVFFSLLVFSMIGCGSEGMLLPPPGNPDSDMMVFNPDAGVDSDVVEDDAGVDDDMGTMVVVLIDECANAALNDCDVNATCTDTEEAYTCECNDGFDGNGITCTVVVEPPVCLTGYELNDDMDTCVDIDECLVGTDTCDVSATCENTVGSFECICDDGFGMNEAGECEQLYVVWVPESIVFNNNNHEASLAAATAVCQDIGGELYSGPWNEWFLGIVENNPVVKGLRPDELEPAHCPLLTDSITTCSYYQNLAETTCTTTANTFCNNTPLFCPSGIGGAQWIERYNNCLDFNMNMNNYMTCSNDTACENEEEIRNNGFVGRAYRSAPGSNHLVPLEGIVPSVVNVICILPESAVTAEFGMDYEFAILYTGAAQ